MVGILVSLLGPGLFSGAMLVSGRVNQQQTPQDFPHKLKDFSAPSNSSTYEAWGIQDQTQENAAAKGSCLVLQKWQATRFQRFKKYHHGNNSEMMTNEHCWF